MLLLHQVTTAVLAGSVAALWKVLQADDD